MSQVATPERCVGCPLDRRTYVGHSGDLKTCKYILVGEAPARDEVRKKTPFVGPTGRLFRKLIAKVRIKEEDCYITNAVKCMIPSRLKGKDKQKVLAAAIKHCRPLLVAELAEVPENVPIAAMGRGARDALLPHLSGGGVLASRGWYHWKDKWDLIVTVHPAYVMYNQGNAPLFLKDMRRLKHGPQDPIEVKHYVLDTLELLAKLIAKMKTVPLAERSFVAYDLETDSKDYQRDRILCMSLVAVPGTAYIIPDSLLYKDGKTFVTTGATKEQVQLFLDSFRYYLGKAYGEPNPVTVELLNEMFSIPGYRWAGHNSKYDLRFLIGQLGVDKAHTDLDTIVAHYTLDERKGGHALKPLADDYFDSGDYEKGIKKWLPSKGGRYSMIPRPALYKYNAMDSEITRKFAVRFEKDLKTQGLWQQPYLFPMMAAYPMLLAMELHGINIDWEELERFAEEEILPGSDVLKEELRELSGHPEMNPASSQQMIKVVYDELKFPLVSFRRRSQGTKVRGRTTEKGYVMACEELWKKGKLPVTKAAWKFILKLREYRHVQKMYSTYTKNWQRHRGTDGRVHPTYQLRGTVTGRLSVVDPPVQTIPNKNRDKWSTGIANIHIPAPGRVLLYADYSQAELRIAGALAMDEFMLAAFKEGAGDFHTAVALQAYGQDFTSDERGFCKRVAYGWLYGGNVYEIALEALHFTEKLSRKLDTSWNKMFHRTNEWRKEVEADVKRLGYSESILGRRRRFPLISRATLFRILRMAINSRIQGASSDMVLISAIELHERYKDSGYAWVLLMVHDSLIMEVEESHAEEVKVVMRQAMEAVASRYFPEVPHEAEVKVGTRLGDLMG